MMVAAALALLLASEPVRNIPEEYRGTWALTRNDCARGFGSLWFEIDARTIRMPRYRAELLSAQVIAGPSGPIFAARFHIVNEGRARDEVYRLQRRDEALSLGFTSGSGEPSGAPAHMIRCPPASG